MSLPALKLSADFETAGTTDLTDFGVGDGITVTRGTSSLVTTGFVAEPGSYSTLLDNWGRRFDPNFATGPYFGDLVPSVPLRPVAHWGSTDYGLIVAQADDWVQQYPNNGVDQNVPLVGHDVISFYSQAQFAIARPAELSGARINAIVNELGGPGPTDIDPGVTVVSALPFGVVSAWSHMSDVANAEWGDLYVAKDDTLTFRDRNRIVTEARSTTPQASYVQSGGFNFSDVQLTRLPLVDDCTITYSDRGAQVNAQDATSILRPWGVKSLPLSLPIQSSSVAQAYAEWVVYLYKNPITTFSSITFTPANEPGATFDLWAELFTRELSDLVTITLDPLDDTGAPSGDPIVRNCWIRGITYNFQQQPWSITFALQDASWIDTLARFDVDLFDGDKVLAF